MVAVVDVVVVSSSSMIGELEVLAAVVASLQAKDTNSTLVVTYPWPLASLKVETPAAPPIEYTRVA